MKTLILILAIVIFVLVVIESIIVGLYAKGHSNYPNIMPVKAEKICTGIEIAIVFLFAIITVCCILTD